MSRTYCHAPCCAGLPRQENRVREAQGGAPRDGRGDRCRDDPGALVRGFEAEAFVIPTGSMAPTLMGRHKEITCPQCGFVYAVNASDEVEGVGAGEHPQPAGPLGHLRQLPVPGRVDDAPSFKGDRILVMKFPYDLPFLPGSSPPAAVGCRGLSLPRGARGQLHQAARRPARRGAEHLLWRRIPQAAGKQGISARPEAARAPAGDADDGLRRRPSSGGAEETPRVAALDPSTTRAGWTEVEPGRLQGTSSSHPPTQGQDAATWSELRYRNLVPDPEQWEAVDRRPRVAPRPPRADLITDFYSYNTNLTAESSSLVDYPRDDQGAAWMQPQWVGDLSISARLNGDVSNGRVRLELVEGGVVNHCLIDLATGKATLSHDETVIGEQSCRINGPGTYEVSFANVDERLTLVVDGRGVFGDGVTYEGSEKHPAPTAADLAPVAIAAKGARSR